MTDMVWKDVKGYEGLYQVSDTGLVRALRAWKAGGRGTGRHVPAERVLIQRDNGKGYLRVRLADKNGRQKEFQVSRLVAEAFCEKAAGANCVTHVNEVRGDNRAENLRWVTKSFLSAFARRG